MERDFARRQILRMAQMGGFPEKYVEAVGELIDALLTAPSEEIARDAITSFVESADSETRCPFPKDIRAAVQSIVRERLGDFLPDPECPKCFGIGDIIVERRGLTGSKRGDCYARRFPPDYSKLPGVEKVDTAGMVEDAAKRLKGVGR